MLFMCDADKVQLAFGDDQGEVDAVAGPSHHVEKDGADECPKSWADAVPLADAHQWDRKISAGGRRASAACGDVMD